ncbi:MAG: TonB family protein [Acidobacteriia bacterium]|nr:TonB family protein [Terriglobia bacterium]
MPRDLFGDAVVRPASRAALRRALTVCSIVLHAVVISSLLVAQLLAVGPLPTPRRPLSFESIRAIQLLDIPLPPPQRTRAEKPLEHAASINAAPIVPPAGIIPETGFEDVKTQQVGVIDGVDHEPGSGEPRAAIVERTPPPAPPQDPIRLHSGMQMPRKLVDVAPVYPAIASAARKEGVVILEAIIDTHGDVASVRVLRSIPLLDQAAVDAVRQWKYTPTLLNGVAVPLVMTVTINFTLQGR